MLYDLQIVRRSLRGSPLMVASAVAILGLTIGASATVFGVADAVVIRSLPYAEPDRVFLLRTTKRLAAGTRVDSSSVPADYVHALATHHRGIAAIGLRSTQSIGMRVGTEVEWTQAIAVTPGYFASLGVRAGRGRLFDTRDADQPGRTALLTYGFWQRRFGGDPAVVGRAMPLGSEARVVIGVLPRGFVFPAVFVDTPYGAAGRPDYVTVAPAPVPGGKTRSSFVSGGGSVVDPVVRLRPGVTREQAQAEIDALVAPLLSGTDRSAVRSLVLHDVRSLVFPTGRRVLTLLLVGSGLVVLIGCANLTIMLAARHRRREVDLGIRTALGATRSQLVRPLLVEVALIGLSGGLAGVVLASLAFDRLLEHVAPDTYGTAAVGVDGRAAVFALSLGLLTGVMSGLWPAWRAARVTGRALTLGRAGGWSPPRRSLLARPLVASQVALAIVLVFAAAVAGQALLAALRQPLGFTAERVVTIHVRPPRDSGPPTTAFYRQAIEVIGRHPEVVSAGAGSSIPFDERSQESDVDGVVGIDRVLPGFLETIGATLVRGRLPTLDDARAEESLCVVSQSAARALFPGLDPLGRHVRPVRGTELTIVGVVANVRKRLDGASVPTVFALPTGDAGRLVLVARVRNRRADTLGALRNEVGRLSPDEPVTAVWWADSIDALVPFRNPRLQAIVLGGFAGLALVLTAVGLFAVVSLFVAAQTREIGVRLAVGAMPSAVVHLMVRQALRPVVVGVVVGMAVTVWVRAFLEAHLFGVSADSPAVLAAVVVMVTLVSALAAYLPARHAGRVDLINVLRVP